MATYLLQLGVHYLAHNGGLCMQRTNAQHYISHDAASLAWRLHAKRLAEVGGYAEAGFTINTDTGEILPVNTSRK